jgi:Lrp/AsnC family transcriptional regulator, leucine-responsive regulatory protein
MDKSLKFGQLDKYDQKIMETLSVEGRLPITDLAKRAGMSKSPCQVRFKKLIRDGFILGFRAILNPTKLDLGHVAFAEVKLLNTTKAALGAFNAAVREIPEVEQCHMIAGPFDYLLKVRTKDINAYRHVLGERISALPHVASSSTYVSMEAIKEVGP